MNQKAEDQKAVQKRSDDALDPELQHAIQAAKNFGLEIKKNLNEYTLIYQAIPIVLAKGVHYGPPFKGSKKDSLLLPGAELVNKLYGDIAMTKIEEREIDPINKSYYVRFRCDLVDKDGKLTATATGTCSSFEESFYYREAKRKCPDCGAEAIMQSKYPDKVTGAYGFYCYKKIGGCGNQFSDEDEDITGQVTGKVVNENVLGQIHNIEARAAKRAHVKATRLRACISGLFDQDAEDGGGSYMETTARPHTEPTPKKIAAPAEKADTFTPDETVENEIKKSALRRVVIELNKMDSAFSKDEICAVLFEKPGLTVASLEKPLKNRKQVARIVEATKAGEQMLARGEIIVPGMNGETEGDESNGRNQDSEAVSDAQVVENAQAQG